MGKAALSLRSMLKASKPVRKRMRKKTLSIDLILEDDKKLKKQHSRLFWEKVLAQRDDDAKVEAMRPLLDFLPEEYFGAYLASESKVAEIPRILDLARLATRLYHSDAAECKSVKG